MFQPFQIWIHLYHYMKNFDLLDPSRRSFFLTLIYSHFDPQLSLRKYLHFVLFNRLQRYGGWLQTISYYDFNTGVKRHMARAAFLAAEFTPQRDQTSCCIGVHLCFSWAILDKQFLNWKKTPFATGLCCHLQAMAICTWSYWKHLR